MLFLPIRRRIFKEKEIEKRREKWYNTHKKVLSRGDEDENHYQLVTAACATLLEAKMRGLKKAMLMVIVFKKNGCFSEEKVVNNDKDIQYFLSHSHAVQADDYWVIPTMFGCKNGIELYFSEITIDLN